MNFWPQRNREGGQAIVNKMVNGEAAAAASNGYFHGPSGTSRRDIWRWWQERRFRYNRDLFCVGLITWLLVVFAGSAAVKPGVDFEEPIMMVVGPMFYALMANLAYTAGPVFDIVVYRAAPRRILA